MNEATIREVFSDENFVKGLFELETPEAVQTALRQKDVVLSVEEIVKTRELLLKHLETGAELSDEELTGVDGGCVLSVLTFGLIAAMIAGALVGGVAVGGGAIGAAYIVNDKTHGQW